MNFKYFIPILAIYLAVCFADLVCVYRMAEVGGFVIAGAIFILPMMYFLEDVMAEVYGYMRARQAIWSMLVGCFVFSTLVNMVGLLPAPAFWHQKPSYDVVFSHLFRVTLGGGCVGLLSGSFINSILISKWKILLRGRYFIVRSITSSAFGQGIQNLLNCFILYLGVVPLHDVLSMVMPLYFIQMTLSVLLSIVGAFLIRFLKRAEDIDIYDYHINYNPFAFTTKEVSN